MPKLIQKSRYIKPGKGGAGKYMAYIATRDGVDLLNEDVERPGTYMRYIAERPRSHGLFSGERSVSLEDTLREVEQHQGPVWTFIYSLKREDAARLGYDSAASWRALIAAHQVELADAMKIPPNDFRWYAAFHDEGHHPHIHLMVWSADPKQGYLTETGIEKMRSRLTNEIFRDEMLSLYQQKDISYKEVVDAARKTMGSLTRQMESSFCDSPVIAEKMVALAEMLSGCKGKKVYGYLKKLAKELVDSIVDELAKLPEVAECYEVWNRLRDEAESYYKDKPREHLPLSAQKEFKSIKNMVVREAEQICTGVFTFEETGADDREPEIEELRTAAQNGDDHAAYCLGKELLKGEIVKRDVVKAVKYLCQAAVAGSADAQYALGKLLITDTDAGMDDEEGPEPSGAAPDVRWMRKMYRMAKTDLYGEDIPEEQKEWAVHLLEELWKLGFPLAAHQLGKCWRDGIGVPPDAREAEMWFRRSAEAGLDCSQYALGKLYLTGNDIKRDRELAVYWLTQAADQGNEYAQFLLDHMEQTRQSSILLSATRLLHHLGRVFRENSVPPKALIGQTADRKLRLQIKEKKLAMGHKADDHEDPAQEQGWGMGMR